MAEGRRDKEWQLVFLHLHWRSGQLAGDGTDGEVSAPAQEARGVVGSRPRAAGQSQP